jgi:acyl-CoA thioesterase
MYTRQGTLIAVLTQEGVVRANVKRPDPPVAEKAKL